MADRTPAPADDPSGRLLRFVVVQFAAYAISAAVIVGTIIFLGSKYSELSRVNRQIEDAREKLIAARSQIQEAQTQIDGLQNQIAASNILIETQKEVLAQQSQALDATKNGPPSAADQQRINAAIDAGKAQQLPNKSFVVFLHYRDDSAESSSFVRAAAKLLLDKGFTVPTASKESATVRVQNTAGLGTEGPHVDFFSDGAQEAAQAIVTLLNNGGLPAGYGPLILKPTSMPKGASASQAQYIGVWL